MKFWERTPANQIDSKDVKLIFSEDYCMYKVGAWLHHEQDLLNHEGAWVNEEKVKSEDREEKRAFHQRGSVIAAHTQQLRLRVVDDKGQPRLGGSSQDKVCAAMLMNNTFFSIDEVDLDKVKRHYFPYVYAASEPYVDPVYRAETPGFAPKDSYLHKVYNPYIADVSAAARVEKYKQATIKYIEKAEKYKTGTIKKFFHIWKGEKCKIVKRGFKRRNENLSRFKILASDNYEGKPFRVDGDIAAKKETAEYAFRLMGIIRLIEADDKLKSLKRPQAQFEYAMQQWLGDWLGYGNEEVGIAICEPSDKQFEAIGMVYLKKVDNEWKLAYYNQIEFSMDTHLLSLSRKFPKLNIQHGEEDKGANNNIKLRSHCSFMTYLYEVGTFSEIPLKRFNSLDNPAKLLETVMTSITFFDDRVFERLPEKQKDVFDPFREQLRIHAFPEKFDIFEEKRPQFLKAKSHFIIFHLSFLETIQKESKVHYKESEVQLFFEKEIEEFYKKEFDTDKFPPNIIFVITSGRGRGDWFQATEHPQITFRPIEAILDAIEDGLSLNDNFQVKYNLCNVLFGS